VRLYLEIQLKAKDLGHGSSSRRKALGSIPSATKTKMTGGIGISDSLLQRCGMQAPWDNLFLSLDNRLVQNKT
jgi:hypothetical protein